jgi:hypothetical protein
MLEKFLGLSGGEFIRGLHWLKLLAGSQPTGVVHLAHTSSGVLASAEWDFAKPGEFLAIQNPVLIVVRVVAVSEMGDVDTRLVIARVEDI